MNPTYADILLARNDQDAFLHVGLVDPYCPKPTMVTRWGGKYVALVGVVVGIGVAGDITPQVFPHPFP